MSWVRVDDGFYSHPKRWLLGERLDAIGLWLLCLCYASHQLTNGYVPKEFVDANRPRPDRRKTLQALLDVGMLVAVEGGYVIHDYLDYQPSREDVVAKRSEVSAARSEAGKKGAAARWQTHGKADGKPDGNSDGNDQAKAA